MIKLLKVGVVLLLMTAVNLFSMAVRLRNTVDILEIDTMPEGVISVEHCIDIKDKKADQGYQELMMHYANQNRERALYRRRARGAEHRNLREDVQRTEDDLE